MPTPHDQLSLSTSTTTLTLYKSFVLSAQLIKIYLRLVQMIDYCTRTPEPVQCGLGFKLIQSLTLAVHTKLRHLFWGGLDTLLHSQRELNLVFIILISSAYLYSSGKKYVHWFYFLARLVLQWVTLEVCSHAILLQLYVPVIIISQV